MNVFLHCSRCINDYHYVIQDQEVECADGRQASAFGPVYPDRDPYQYPNRYPVPPFPINIFDIFGFRQFPPRYGPVRFLNWPRYNPDSWHYRYSDVM